MKLGNTKILTRGRKRFRRYEDSMRAFRLFTNMSIPNLDTVLEILHVWYFILKVVNSFYQKKKLKKYRFFFITGEQFFRNFIY